MGWIADLLKEVPSAARYKAELEAMEKENASLKTENANLKSELEAVRKELAAKKQPATSLNQEAENILAFIASHEYTTTQQIARSLALSKGVTDMHLEDLVASKYIDASYAVGQEPEYYLKQNGRRYLFSRGLL